MVVIVVLLVTTPFYTPPAHQISTPGATALDAQQVVSNPYVPAYGPIQPSESLDSLRCQLWRAQNHLAACPDAATLASTYFPRLAQSPMTLYVPLTPCSNFNVEYLSRRGTLVIHCITTEPWISTQPRLMGVEAVPRLALVLIPTQSLPAGPVDVVQDRRTERLLLDDSQEVLLGTATIA